MQSTKQHAQRSTQQHAQQPTACTLAGFSVIITRKQIRHMYVRLDARGNVLVSAPPQMSKQCIAEFLNSRRAWIERHQSALRAQAAHFDNLWAPPSEQPTEQPTVQPIAQPTPQPTARPAAQQSDQSDQSDHFNQSEQHEQQPHQPSAQPQPPQQLQQPQLEHHPSTPIQPTTFWTPEREYQARSLLDIKLPTLLWHWERIVGKSPTSITYRRMSSRWGSCTPRTGRIRLNLQLGLMSNDLLEYVLVHELTHLWVGHHNAEFHERMSRYLPRWQALREELNAYQAWK